MTLLLLLAGCDPVGSPTACTEMAAASVSLEVVDETGAAIDAATATYSVDGGSSQPCDELSANALVCGWEQEGHLVVTVSADGFDDAVEEFDIASDGCHVEGASATVTLPASDTGGGA
jgi:hypothetical protein